ncbi:uncharacterized protein LOC129729214 [Wyeomyia smithii]|uniref:uncharacterized protein LOC129729214 n=1 Tax=Wyeomyia smithii TaxID=174621 RepID=UPI002467DC3E|nr:uncharacterized protein LOC129729214 [Wyeomyia smithii]
MKPQIFRKKKRRLEEEEYAKLEQQHHSQETFVGSYQVGFVEERSTADQYFIIRQILQKCRKYVTPTHHLFINFKAAYDTIDCNELWKVMDENGFPGKLVSLTKATVDGTQFCVRISGGLSGPFESRRCLRQGDELCSIGRLMLACSTGYYT